MNIDWDKTQIMVDLETLGTAPGCAILSIGAAKFDQNGIINTFYTTIRLESNVDCGLTINPNTLKWWVAQNGFKDLLLSENAKHINSAFIEFSTWADNENRKIDIWGNGSDFDNAILSYTYDKLRIARPKGWSYSGNRCYRTVKNLYPEIEIDRIGEHHNAVDDAKSQALHLIKIWNLSNSRSLSIV